MAILCGRTSKTTAKRSSHIIATRLVLYGKAMMVCRQAPIVGRSGEHSGAHEKFDDAGLCGSTILCGGQRRFMTPDPSMDGVDPRTQRPGMRTRTSTGIRLILTIQ